MIIANHLAPGIIPFPNVSMILPRNQSAAEPVP